MGGPWRHWANVKNHVGDLLSLPLPMISREQIAAVLTPIWKGPTVGVGFKLRGFLERVFNANDVSPNPATWERLRHLLSDVEHRPAMPFGDVPAFMAGLDDGPLSAALRFTILSACRTQEVLDMDWSEVEGDMWIIPAARMKQGREHAVPLTPEMLAVLGKPQKAGRVFVTSNTASGAINPGSLLKYLKKLRPGVTTHGFRASFASWAEAQRYSTKTIDLCLAHVEGNRTRRAYLRAELWDERRALMAAWAAFAVSGS